MNAAHSYGSGPSTSVFLDLCCIDCKVFWEEEILPKWVGGMIGIRLQHSSISTMLRILWVTFYTRKHSVSDEPFDILFLFLLGWMAFTNCLKRDFLNAIQDDITSKRTLDIRHFPLPYFPHSFQTSAAVVAFEAMKGWFINYVYYMYSPFLHLYFAHSFLSLYLLFISHHFFLLKTGDPVALMTALFAQQIELNEDKDIASHPMKLAEVGGSIGLKTSDTICY